MFRATLLTLAVPAAPTWCRPELQARLARALARVPRSAVRLGKRVRLLRPPALGRAVPLRQEPRAVEPAPALAAAPLRRVPAEPEAAEPATEVAGR